MSTHRNTWKAAERRVAALFGALRQRLSGSSGREDESAADVKHPTLFIEVKYRDVHAVRTLYDKTEKLAKKEKKAPVVALVDKGRPGFLICTHIDHLSLVADALRRCETAGDHNEGFYEEE